MSVDATPGWMGEVREWTDQFARSLGQPAPSEEDLDAIPALVALREVPPAQR